MAGEPAELAFGHAMAMLGDPQAAEEVAVTALRRAGRARGLVLAHAREQAVARAAEDEPVDIANLKTVVLDLPALAATLASTRPPEERAALDVRARTGGDLAALGDSLGMRPTAAAEKCSEIAELWERTLDPALLVCSGPGECEALGAILDGAPRDTVSDLLALAPAVHAHTQHCTACTDRTRAMASVRSFFSGGAVEVPKEVRDTGHVSRRRRPAAPPAPLFTEPTATPAPRRRGTRWRWAGVAALGGLVAAVAGFLVVSDDPPEVSDLTALSGDRIVLSAPEVSGDRARIRLENRTGRAVSYRAAMSSQWASVSPRTGRLRSGASVVLVVRALETAPEGVSRTTLTVTTSAGGVTTAEIGWTLENPPDLSAVADGCAVDVHVVEEGELASLVLHWRDSTEHEQPITPSADGYRVELKPEGQDITYWVTAVDGRGNQARTADQVIPVGAC